jgi:hypothetical protein
MKSRSAVTVRTFSFSRSTRAVGALLLSLAGSGLYAAERIDVTLDPRQVLERQFMGFGVQWEYEGSTPLLNSENPRWMARWAEMERRIDYMRPSILRVMHDARNYTDLQNGKCVVNYDKKNMTTVYKILDYAQSRQIPVLFGEWWLEANIRVALGGYESARWQEELFVPLLKHLKEKRKYSVIRYLNLVNEPAGCIGLNEPPGSKYMDFSTWKRIMLNLDAALKKNGLRDTVKIVGPDGPGDFSDWIRFTAGDPELNQVIDAYEYHIYAHPKTSIWVAGLDDGRLEQEELGHRRRIVNALDPKGCDKPFFMGEAGVDGRKDQADNQPDRYHFEYGLRMADYAVQSMRAGQAGLIAWDMDDAMHQWGSYGSLGLKGWGFWNSLAGADGYPDSDFDLRPWYYAWSLVCRYFPKDSQTFDAHILIDTSVRTLRVAACKLPNGKGYSVALVNRSEKPFEVKLNACYNMAAGAMKEFHYAEGAFKGSADKEPRPAVVHQKVDLNASFLLTCPAKTFVVLTSME